VKRQEKVFNHRTDKFFDGRFHPSQPRVVAPLADAGKTHFLVFGDFRRRVSQLTVEWLASVNTLQNPTRKQILFRVSRVATENAELHTVKFSTHELPSPPDATGSVPGEPQPIRFPLD